MNNYSDLNDYLRQRKELIDAAIQKFIPGEHGKAATLYNAMLYSLFPGGKRLRPILVLAASEAVGGKTEELLPIACATELIHTYSLIHDDLPAIDNDDFRRGRLTNHKVFGEAAAILAGDALLTDAFGLLTSPETTKLFPSDKLIQAVYEIACAAGSKGMVGGQMVDIESEGVQAGRETIDFIHQNKTGALITSSIRIGALLGGGSSAQLEALTNYGCCIGLAFQIADDILDVEGNAELLGKSVHADAQLKKATYPSLFGVEQSRRRANELVDESVRAIADFGPEADPLRLLALYIVKRDR